MIYSNKKQKKKIQSIEIHTFKYTQLPFSTIWDRYSITTFSFGFNSERQFESYETSDGEIYDKQMMATKKHGQFISLINITLS